MKDNLIAEPVTVAVINYDGGEVLKETLDSIFKMDYPSFKVKSTYK